jgi:hypothetical protein
MQQRGKLQEVLLLEQQEYVHFFDHLNSEVASCSRTSVVCVLYSNLY